uniref:Uncharacterized protein n=1 Tax=Daphnia galeata TaxID=27404 RepID=A0A8J2WVF7_9CRUS|nr:unnamed protein product [Daphnia galeata]
MTQRMSQPLPIHLFFYLLTEKSIQSPIDAFENFGESRKALIIGHQTSKWMRFGEVEINRSFMRATLLLGVLNNYTSGFMYGRKSLAFALLLLDWKDVEVSTISSNDTAGWSPVDHHPP